MQMIKNMAAVGATALLLAAPSMALSATTFNGTFTLGGDAFSDPGLAVSTLPAAGGSGNPITQFSLNEGGSTTFDLFDIWTDEESVDLDDIFPHDIAANFSFTSPSGAGMLDGEVVGRSVIALQDGYVSWDNPLEVYYGDSFNGLFTISLSSENFNLGFFGLNEGQAYGATVEATITLVNEVPLPASALLLFSGLGGLGFMARRRRAAA